MIGNDRQRLEGCARQFAALHRFPLQQKGQIYPGHVAAHAAKALATASGRAAVEHAWTTLTTANPSAEPASPEARDVLRRLGRMLERCEVAALAKY